MNAERPPIRFEAVRKVLEAPDADDGASASGWQGRRTVIVRYVEYEDEIYVKSISATRRRLAP